MSAETPGYPWLAELTERYGEPRVSAGPSRQWDDDGNFTRECWAWFPGNVNHHVGLDQFDGGTWRLKAGRHDGLMADIYYRTRPADFQVRAVLAEVQLLDFRYEPPGVQPADRAVVTRRVVTGEERPAPGEWHADWKPDSRDPDGNLILRHVPTGGLYRVIPVED